MALKKILLSQAATEYLEQMGRRNKSDQTLRTDRMVLDLLIRMVGDIQAKHVTSKHIDAMFYGKGGVMDEHAVREGARTHKAVSPTTHNHYRSRLKVFFKWCADHDYMLHVTGTQCFDKDSGVVTPMTVPEKRRQQPPPSKLLALLDAAENPRDRAYIAVALNSGLRSNEIKRITWGDVDLEEGYIAVTIRKTGQEDELPISEDLDRELRRWVLVYQGDLGRHLEDEDYLFPSRSGYLIIGSKIDPLTGNRVAIRAPHRWETDKQMPRTERIVQRAMEKIGLPTFYEGTHTIRRAVALAYFEMASAERGDMDALKETSTLLHHKNMATTEKYIGSDTHKRKRNKRLRAKPFLTALVEHETQAEVVQLRPVAEGE